MDSAEAQYALDMRNHLKLPLTSFGAEDNVFNKPLQVGHLTGDVIIESEVGPAEIIYAGPPGRAVFEFDYTGEQTPPRLFFRNIYCELTASDNAHCNFLKVIQPGTSPKAIFINNCKLQNNGSYLIDGSDVSGCEGIQIKNSEGSGSGFLRWRLRSGENMGFLEVSNFRYQTGGRVGPSTDLKNTRGVSFCVYTDEQSTDLRTELRGNLECPLSHRFVNPKGYNWFEHNWNEYATNWTVEAPGCWATSIRVDDVSGNYGMHYMRRYMTPMSGGTSTGVPSVQIMGGGDSVNSGSLFVEKTTEFYVGSFDISEGELFGGKVFPRISSSWDMPDSVNTQYTDLNAGGIVDRYDVYESDGQPVLNGNTRTGYYNTQTRLNRTASRYFSFEDILLAKQQKAYGDASAETTYDGDDVIVRFRESGTLTVVETIQVEYLLAGGGASGGAQPPEDSQCGGGGGAGGFLSNFGGTKATLTPGTYPVVVGDGGMFEWGTYGQGTDGEDSSFNGITVPGGGGGGGSVNGVAFSNGRSGGCGGGAASRTGVTGGVGSAYGYAGGSASGTINTNNGASGGGGAGGVGGDGSAGTPGAGGAGIQSSITGTAVWYCEGGGGGDTGSGGNSGGGYPRNANTSGNERDGKANLGGGGGGGSTDTATPPLIYYPGNGGSGVVIIRYSSL